MTASMNEFAALLYDKVNNLEQEGLKYVPYAVEIQAIFQDADGKVRPRSRTYDVLSLFFMLISI
jgi:hypothetical protein